jgi:hypothetical protein
VDWLRATLCQHIHHLAMVATRRWFGFGWRHNNASTIWRWWLQEDGFASSNTRVKKPDRATEPARQPEDTNDGHNRPTSDGC